MRDYLSELCSKLNIGLIYTESDFTALSSGIKDNIPFIKANKMFRGCSEKVAKAIIDYYTGLQYGYDCLQILESYILDNVVSVEYTIEPPDVVLKNLYMEHNETNIRDKGTINEQSIYKEKDEEQSAPQGKTTKRGTSKGKTTKKSAVKGKVPKDDFSALVEAEIASIIKSSFWGESSKIDPNEAIKPSKDDVIDLEIEIEDSNL